MIVTRGEIVDDNLKRDSVIVYTLLRININTLALRLRIKFIHCTLYSESREHVIIL